MNVIRCIVCQASANESEIRLNIPYHKNPKGAWYSNAWLAGNGETFGRWFCCPDCQSSDRLNIAWELARTAVSKLKALEEKR